MGPDLHYVASNYKYKLSSALGPEDTGAGRGRAVLTGPTTHTWFRHLGAEAQIPTEPCWLQPGCTGFLKWCRWPQIWWLGGTDILRCCGWKSEIQVCRVGLSEGSRGESLFPLSLCSSGCPSACGRSMSSPPLSPHSLLFFTRLSHVQLFLHLGLNWEPTQMI